MFRQAEAIKNMPRQKSSTGKRVKRFLALLLIPLLILGLCASGSAAAGSTVGQAASPAGEIQICGKL